VEELDEKNWRRVGQKPSLRKSRMLRMKMEKEVRFLNFRSWRNGAKVRSQEMHGKRRHTADLSSGVESSFKDDCDSVATLILRRFGQLMKKVNKNQSEKNKKK
jgi:hypothetical protein